ncbi:MAG: (2Fe-2S)-binding protein [Pontiellaceae bacterium]|nr:(2Fe-2S)-binding protein [Pontiellaceae bacterium]
MVELKINGANVAVEDGATVLDAAERLQIEIPTLCHLKGAAPQTSCMICVVKDAASGRMLPACSSKATDGMQIETECEEVQSARRDILNLLLSEHVGDCEAPCSRICPAHLDIPHMMREIQRGNVESAAWIARRDLAIPRILSHVCPAPCEKGCRRGQMDSPLTIRTLHGAAYSADLASRLPPDGSLGFKAAVIGSGAAGLACAWQLRLLGFDVTVFDEAPQLGGPLREIASLPSEVLDAEIDVLRSVGISFIAGASLVGSFDCVVESAAEEHKLVVKAVANGKAAANAMLQRLASSPAKESPSFDSRIGKLRDSEVEQLAANCTSDLSNCSDAGKEAARCLHCDCRKPVSCRLRKYAARYGADAAEYPAEERTHVQLLGKDGSVVFEPGKCIKCGLCIEIARRTDESLGLAFIGRGYHTRVTVPFSESLDAGLRVAARECVETCPTGALAFRNAEER